MQTNSPIKPAEQIAVEKGLFYKPFFLAPAQQIFAERAVRFDELAAEEGGDWSNYLRLLADLSRAQQSAADQLSAALPPLNQGKTVLPAADGSLIPPEFYSVLGQIAAQMKTQSFQTGIQRIAALTQAEAEALAAQVLQGEYAEQDASLFIWIHAALQVVWTAWAQQLSDEQVPPVSERSVCPCCGGEAVASVVLANGDWNNLRYLHCAVCNSRWNAVRAQCTFCGDQSGIVLQEIEHAADGALRGARAESCERCGHYRKMFMLQYQQYAEPVADDLASLALDILVGEAGYLRGGHNPFLPVE